MELIPVLRRLRSLFYSRNPYGLKNDTTKVWKNDDEDDIPAF